MKTPTTTSVLPEPATGGVGATVTALTPRGPSSTLRPVSGSQIFIVIVYLKCHHNNLSRFTGAPDDWRYDTINFYLQENFSGDEFYLYQDSVTDTNCRYCTITNVFSVSDGSHKIESPVCYR